MSYQEYLNYYQEIEKTQQDRVLKMSEVNPIIKINLSKEIGFHAIADLDNMNIDYASLFPGLDGFTKSLYFHTSMKRPKMIAKITVHYEDEEPKGDGSASPVG